VTVSISAVLAACTWADLGVPRTELELRGLRRRLHPDACRDRRAGEAFAHIEALYAAPDVRLRVATGRRGDPGRIRWTPEHGFTDLGPVAQRAHAALTRAEFPRFFSRASTDGRDAEGLDVRYDDAGESWWFLRAWPALDARSAVWIARRLAAAVAQAASVGWVHGDIGPDTVAICPSEHGLRLDGWWTAVRVGEPLAVAPSALTPPRYLGGAATDARLGVAQAAALLDALVSPREDRRADGLAAVFAAHALRPGDPADFLGDVDAAATRMFGPPRWHPLADPAVPAI
jgi:hypothetical protein